MSVLLCSGAVISYSAEGVNTPQSAPAVKEAQSASTAKETQPVVPSVPAVGDKTVIKGTIGEIADDNTYMVVNGTKINTPEGFIEDYFLLKGDEVEVTVKKIDKGYEAVDSNFTFTDEDMDNSFDETADESPAPKGQNPGAEK